MSALFRLIWSVCRLESGPEIMPYSIPLTGVLLLFHLLLVWYQFALQADVDTALAQTGLLLLLFVTFTYLVLAIRGQKSRFIQTLTALLSANILINLLHLPMLIITPWILYPGQLQWVMLLFTLVVLVYIISLNVWLVAITAHVFSRALDKTFLVGLLVTIAMLGMNVIAFAWLIH